MRTHKQQIRRKRLIILSIILGVFVLLGIWFWACTREIFPLLARTISPGQTHLIILQNEAESRPTGGFIGAYAVVKTGYGMPEISISDSYTLENHAPETAPEPVNSLLDDGEWYGGHFFRDANLDPNFPNSAQELIRMYNLNFESETEFASVWAVNFGAIENLVGALGGLTVDGQNLTKENLFYTLEVALRPTDAHSLESLATRKDFLKDFAKELIWQSFFPWNWGKISASLSQSLDQKEIQVYYPDGEFAEWNGALTQTDGDFLHLNLANYGGKKTDRYLQREANYLVQIDASGNATAHLTITLTNPEKPTLFTGDYYGWLRVYNAENRPEISQEIEVPMGTTQTYDFTYKLPGKYKDEYTLYLSKQSGADWNLDVDVRASGQRFWSSDDFEIRENHAYFHGILEKDTELKAKLLSDTTPPFITNQHFSDLNTLWVDTSEPLLLNRAVITTNYTLTDLDETNPTHDTPEIIAVEHYDNILKITLQGMTNQPEEQYKLTFKNLLDQSGNPMGELSVTVIQRY